MNYFFKKMILSVTTCSFVLLSVSRLSYASSEEVTDQPTAEIQECSNSSKEIQTSPNKSMAFEEIKLEEFNQLTINDLRLSCTQRFEKIYSILNTDTKKSKRKRNLAGRISGSVLLIPVMGVGFISMAEAIDEYRQRKKVRNTIKKSLRDMTDLFYISQIIIEGHASDLPQRDLDLFKRLYQNVLKEKMTETYSDTDVAEIYFHGMESGFLCQNISMDADYLSSKNYLNLYTGKADISYVENVLSSLLKRQEISKNHLTEGIRRYQERKEKAFETASRLNQENDIFTSESQHP